MWNWLFGRHPLGGVGKDNEGSAKTMTAAQPDATSRLAKNGQRKGFFILTQRNDWQYKKDLRTAVRKIEERKRHDKRTRRALQL